MSTETHPNGTPPHLMPLPAAPPRSAASGTRVVTRGAVIVPTQGKGFTGKCGFDYNLNPAIGCRFGCSYCYAANFTQDKAPEGLAWGQWTTLKAQSGAAISQHAPLGGKSIYMSTATDPYQPAEKEARITRGILEALALPKHQGVTLVVQTRSPLVVRDTELLLDIHRHGLVQVNMSVTTDSEGVRKHFEPTCPPIETRLQAVAQLVAAGVQCAVTVTPMLPLEDPLAFAARLAGLHLNSVVIQPFHEVQTQMGVRSTRSEALDTLAAMKLTPEDIKVQARVLWKELRRLGMNVGANQEGFNVPERQVR